MCSGDGVGVCQGGRRECIIGQQATPGLTLRLPLHPLRSRAHAHDKLRESERVCALRLCGWVGTHVCVCVCVCV